jgi:abortive infection bacteriophage resistance protein
MFKTVRRDIKRAFHSFIVMIIILQRPVPNTNGINEFRTLTGTDVHLRHLQMYLYKQKNSTDMTL